MWLYDVLFSTNNNLLHITGLMAAIFDFTRKKGLSSRRILVGVYGCFTYTHQVKFCWKTFVNIFVHYK